MRAPHPPPDRPRKLTLRRIREMCRHKVFKRGSQIYGWGVIEDADLKPDGTLTGMTIEDKEYLLDLYDTSNWEMDEPTSDRVYRMVVSLQTGKWHCTCPYSRVDVCSHVVALLICAATELDATVPVGDLPIQRRSRKPSVIPYRDQTLRILAQSDSIESADGNLADLLELATACRMEGDTTEALTIHLGLTEALLYGLDYPKYSEYFAATMDRGERLFGSVPEPTSMDELRVYKFGVASHRLDQLFRIKLEYEPKILSLVAMHRMFMMTNPWKPSGFYLYQLMEVPRAKKYYEFMRRLHDPVVPTHTPDWREDPVGFQATLNLAYYQSILYQKLKDPSLLDFYKQHYRDDFETCIRYIQYLKYIKPKYALPVMDECRHLFPDDTPWDFDSITRPPTYI